MQFDLIVAVDSEFGIARNGNLPWKGSAAGREDMEWFKKATTEPCTAVIMGRLTWESIPQKFRPLPGRINIVLSKSCQHGVHHGDPTAPSVVYLASLGAALDWCVSSRVERCFVIGGAHLYAEALLHPLLRFGYVTQFKQSYDCDLKIDSSVLRGYEISTRETEHAKYHVVGYNNREEDQYLDLLQKLLTSPLKPNRTGVDTRSLFHEVLKFNLWDPVRGRVLPLLTTKRVPWKAVVVEALWFLSGKCTNTRYLHAHGVKIWDANSTREFLDKQGLDHYAVGELGPIYGYQWRHWNSEFYTQREMVETYNGKVFVDGELVDIRPQGIDQLTRVIEGIKKDPWGRRHVVSAWNPEQLDEMALAPCHWSFQFVVDPDEHMQPGRLNCIVNMRSADVALGVPFNIASYSLITHIVSLMTGIKPGVISISMADCHIYQNHIDGVREQILRCPRRFPTFRFGSAVNSYRSEKLSVDDLAEMDPAEFIVENYTPEPTIYYPMAV